MKRFVWIALVVALAVPGRFLNSATSTAWETNGFADFLKGRLTGLSLTADGILIPGPAQRWRADLGQPALWSLVAGPDGTIYAATGHSGRVFRIDRDGRQTQVWASEQAEVFALALDSQGRLYAGTSPNGGVYRLSNGKAEQIWQSPVKYIWNLLVTSGGELFVGTGESGRIYRLDQSGTGGIYYETEQANVTALAIGNRGQLYAGTEPNGIVYEISGPKQATVLYDSTLPEIRAIVPASDGSVYLAAMGGALSTRTSSAAGSTSNTSTTVTATNPTVITVTEAHGSENVQSAVRTSGSAVVPATNPVTSTPAVSVGEVAGLEKSAIYRVAADRTVETLRSSKEDNVYDLALSGTSLLFSTDDQGRVYRMNGSKVTLLVEPGDGETTRLVQRGDELYLALSNPARVLSFQPGSRGPGTYLSPVHDSGSVARWGHLQWRGDHSSGLRFQTRTGNSVRPDSTWSSWSALGPDTQHSQIASPIARYVQWRSDWDANSLAECSSVSLPYLPQNGAPVIRSVTVTSVLGTNPAKTAATASSSSSAYSVTVTDTGDAPAASTTSTSSQNVSHLQTTQTQISWQADDPDSDKLVYALYFRPEEAHDWQLIRSRMAENTLLLDPDVFADGHYLFRVVASDAPSNAVQYVKSAELVSSTVLIDNTPPIVAISKPRREGTAINLSFVASDAISSLRRCEYSIDGGYWQPIEPVDGIIDSSSETFELHLEKLRPGEHFIAVRAYDVPGNAGLASVLIR